MEMVYIDAHVMILGVIVWLGICIKNVLYSIQIPFQFHNFCFCLVEKIVLTSYKYIFMYILGKLFLQAFFKHYGVIAWSYNEYLFPIIKIYNLFKGPYHMVGCSDFSA